MAEPARLIQTVSRAAMIVTVAVTMAVMMYCNVLEGEGVGGWNIKLRNDSFLSPSVKGEPPLSCSFSSPIQLFYRVRLQTMSLPNSLFSLADVVLPSS